MKENQAIFQDPQVHAPRPDISHLPHSLTFPPLLHKEIRLLLFKPSTSILSPSLFSVSSGALIQKTIYIVLI